MIPNTLDEGWTGGETVDEDERQQAGETRGKAMGQTREKTWDESMGRVRAETQDEAEGWSRGENQDEAAGWIKGETLDETMDRMVGETLDGTMEEAPGNAGNGRKVSKSSRDGRKAPNLGAGKRKNRSPSVKARQQIEPRHFKLLVRDILPYVLLAACMGILTGGALAVRRTRVEQMGIEVRQEYEEHFLHE